MVLYTNTGYKESPTVKVNYQKAKFSLKLVVLLLGILGLAMPVFSKLSGSLTEEAITERIKPIGAVKISGVEAVKASKKSLTPETIYTKYCSTCHQSGVLNAPKVGDKNDWNKRLEKGFDKLLLNALHGYNNMPAMGTCYKCTEDDIKASIEYMLK